MDKRSAIKKINKQGVLLVFPILNKKEPGSLWAQFFPRKKMKWEWSDNGDDSVAQMWSLMKKLSDCGEVVYSKWYQGRATFFSKDVFKAMLRVYQSTGEIKNNLSYSATSLYEALREDSPLSTKQLKALTEMQGKLNEPNYNRGCKELFSRFLIVAYGEVDDGAFPSLALGATETLYEELWREGRTLNLQEAHKTIDNFLPEDSLFRKYFEKVKKDLGFNPNDKHNQKQEEKN